MAKIQVVIEVQPRKIAIEISVATDPRVGLLPNALAQEERQRIDLVQGDSAHQCVDALAEIGTGCGDPREKCVGKAQTRAIPH